MDARWSDNSALLGMYDKVPGVLWYTKEGYSRHWGEDKRGRAVRVKTLRDIVEL